MADRIDLIVPAQRWAVGDHVLAWPRPLARASVASVGVLLSRETLWAGEVEAILERRVGTRWLMVGAATFPAGPLVDPRTGLVRETCGVTIAYSRARLRDQRVVSVLWPEAADDLRVILRVARGAVDAAVRLRGDEPGIDDTAPLPLHHSVAHDGTSDVGASFNGASSVALSGKTTAGSNRCGVVGVGGWVQDDVSGVTWGSGNAMTLVGTSRWSPPSNWLMGSLWRYVAPATTSQTVTATFNAASWGGAGASSFTGVDQTTPIRGSAATANGTANDSPSVVVTSAVDDMVVDAVGAQGASTPVAGADQTEYFSQTPGGGDMGFGSYEAGAASVTMSWSGLTTSADWATVGASLQAAAAPGAGWGPLLGLQNNRLVRA